MTINAVPKPNKKSTRQQINNNNRKFGRSVEVKVAQLLGGHRVPMSGAIKNSIWRLEGDVRVSYTDSPDVLALIECKGSSKISAKGDKLFTLKRKVLEQADSEAQISGGIPAVWVHWKGADYQNEDFVLIPYRLQERLERYFKMGREPTSIKPVGSKTFTLNKSYLDGIIKVDQVPVYARLDWEDTSYMIMTSQQFIDIIDTEQKEYHK